MIYIILAVFGIALGSFINALVWRVRMQDTHKKSIKKYSITKGRSMCVHCGHTLSAPDLIPLFSWLLLVGRCRYCKKKISKQYPIVELATMLLFLSSYALWPANINTVTQYAMFITWLLVLVGLVALFVYDLKWMELPNRIIFPLIGLVIVQIIFIAILNSSIEPLKLGLFGFGAIGGVFYLLFAISNGKWIGGGDVKLGFLIGILLADPAKSVGVIFLASLLGTITLVPIILLGRYKSHMKLPFGPYLITATVVMMLFGDKIVDYYLNSLI